MASQAMGIDASRPTGEDGLMVDILYYTTMTSQLDIDLDGRVAWCARHRAVPSHVGSRSWSAQLSVLTGRAFREAVLGMLATSARPAKPQFQVG